MSRPSPPPTQPPPLSVANLGTQGPSAAVKPGPTAAAGIAGAAEQTPLHSLLPSPSLTASKDTGSTPSDSLPKRTNSTTVRIRRRSRPNGSSIDSPSATSMQRQSALGAPTRPRRSTQGVSYVEPTSDDEDGDVTPNADMVRAEDARLKVAIRTAQDKTSSLTTAHQSSPSPLSMPSWTRPRTENTGFRGAAPATSPPVPRNESTTSSGKISSGPAAALYSSAPLAGSSRATSSSAAPIAPPTHVTQVAPARPKSSIGMTSAPSLTNARPSNQAPPTAVPSMHDITGPEGLFESPQWQQFLRMFPDANLDQSRAIILEHYQEIKSLLAAAAQATAANQQANAAADASRQGSTLSSAGPAPMRPATLSNPSGVAGKLPSNSVLPSRSGLSSPSTTAVPSRPSGSTSNAQTSKASSSLTAAQASRSLGSTLSALTSRPSGSGSESAASAAAPGMSPDLGRVPLPNLSSNGSAASIGMANGTSGLSARKLPITQAHETHNTPSIRNNISANMSASTTSPSVATAQGSTQVSPTKTRPQKPQTKFISSRNYAPNLKGSKDDVNALPAKEGGMKRIDRKSKAGSSTPDLFLSSGSALTVPPDPARHPTRRARQVSPADAIPLQSVHDSRTTSLGAVIPTYSSSPREPPPRRRQRLFELPDAPTFYPTWEEFANPMKYIQWVSSPQGGKGKEYGIVKIVPPEGWHMDCVLDQSTFRFRTRVQQLNSLTADARANQNYQEQLQKFHSQQGSPRVSIPVIDNRPVDLYQLKLAVKKQGGYELITKGRHWPEVTRSLGYPESLVANIFAQVKAAYTKIILPFEVFLSRAREQAKAGNGSPADEYRGSHLNAIEVFSSGENRSSSEIAKELLAAGLTSGELAQAQAEAEGGSKRRSSRKRADTQIFTQGGSGRTRGRARGRGRSRGRGRGRGGASGSKARMDYDGDDSDIDSDDLVTVDGAEEQMCEICLKGDNGMAMLLCDDCNRGYHMYCLEPPLATIPKSQWFCPPCLLGTGNDYGFDDGETHSLNSFWQRSDAFRRSWFLSHPNAIWDGKDTGDSKRQLTGNTGMTTTNAYRSPPNGVCRPIYGTKLRVSEDDVEREFWRLVDSSEETVEVEYGADVHSTTHGSASPTLETHPLNSYARDGWNLNNLPILPNSLLRYIKSDISGMTVPWIYVGMIFSTFCWHNEDHYTYSVNYQHWGDTKTWYGIPGADANKFEEAMRKVAPDLFETSPDLLFQLVTMMSPQKLRKEGVRVYACDQRANEFVITYPKAYHSGFNHGYNLNEAVNFALPDWIKFDLEAVLRYQRFARPPVFSHDELLVTASQHNTSIEAAMWMQKPLEEMLAREINLRTALRQTVSGLQESCEDRDRVEEAEYQCSHCSCFCYLAQIVSPNVEGVACLEHGFEVCQADNPKNWVLRLRYSDNHLETLVNRVRERAEHPSQWQKRFRKLLIAHSRPPLRNLRSLLQEGEKLGSQVPELEQLRDFVAQANEWVQNAIKYMPKRHGGRPTTNIKRRRRSALASQSPTPRQGTSGIDEDEQAEPLTVTSLRSFVREGEDLPFDAPEFAVLREALALAEKAEGSCRSVLSRIEKGEKVSTAECERVLLSCEGLNVEVEEYTALKKHSHSHKWVDELDSIWNNFINYHEVQELLREFAETGLPTSHHYYTGLQERLAKGESWKEEAASLLSGSTERTLERLERLTSTEEMVPVVTEMHSELEDLLKVGKDCSKAIAKILEATNECQGREQELSDARKSLRAVHSAKLDLDMAVQLQRDIDLHDEWRSDMLEAVVTVFREEDEVVSAKQIQGTVQDFVNRVERGFELALDQLQSLGQPIKIPKDLCFCGTKIILDEGNNGRLTQCQGCLTLLHDRCARPINPDDKDDGDEDIRSYRTPLSTHAQCRWRCALCRPADLPRFLRSRHATILKFLEDLFGPKFTSTKMRFLPHEFERLQDSLAKAKKHSQIVKTLLDDHLVGQDEILGYRKVLYGLLVSPVDFDAGTNGSPINRCVLALFSAAGLDSAGKRIRPRSCGVAPGSTSGSAVAPSGADGASAMDMDDDGSGMPDVTILGVSTSPAAAPKAARPAAPLPISSVAASAMSGASIQAPAPAAADLKRKRGKRAKFVFREEVGIWVPVQGQRIYCLCHKKETGEMICCDRCMLWFHNDCVHIPPDFGEQKWHCPMCCIKTEKKYPHAEVKVKEMGVTAQHSWLDVRASLRSTHRPVSKVQLWSVPPEKRIILHLDSFYPAIHAEPSGSEQAKRIRIDDGHVIGAPPGGIAIDSSTESAAFKGLARSGRKHSPIVLGEDDEEGGDDPAYPPGSTKLASVVARPSTLRPAIRSSDPATASSFQKGQIGAATAQMHAAETDAERYEAGMANLRARGVSDAMISRYAVGWNGHTLVYPRYDPENPAAELDLGETIHLSPNDPDGTILIRSVKARQLQQDLAAGIPRPPGMGFGAPPLPRHGPITGTTSAAARQSFGQPSWATKQAPSTYGGMHRQHRSPDTWQDLYYGYGPATSNVAQVTSHSPPTAALHSPSPVPWVRGQPEAGFSQPYQPHPSHVHAPPPPPPPQAAYAENYLDPYGPHSAGKYTRVPSDTQQVPRSPAMLARQTAGQGSRPSPRTPIQMSSGAQTRTDSYADVSPNPRSHHRGSSQQGQISSHRGPSAIPSPSLAPALLPAPLVPGPITAVRDSHPSVGAPSAALAPSAAPKAVSIAGSSTSPAPGVILPGISPDVDHRETYRQMAKRMKPDADEAELERMVDRILSG